MPSGEAAATKSSREAEEIVRELAPIEFAPLPTKPERIPKNCTEIRESKFGPYCAHEAWITASTIVNGAIDF